MGQWLSHPIEEGVMKKFHIYYAIFLYDATSCKYFITYYLCELCLVLWKNTLVSKENIVFFEFIQKENFNGLTIIFSI